MKWKSIHVISVTKETLITGSTGNDFTRFYREGLSEQEMADLESKRCRHMIGAWGRLKGQNCQGSVAGARIIHLMNQKINTGEEKGLRGVWCEVRLDKQVTAKQCRALRELSPYFECSE